MSYLTAENLYVIFLHPVSLLSGFVLIFVNALFIFFEIAALYVYCEMGWQQERVSIFKLLKQALYQCRKFFHIKHLLLFFVLSLTTVLTILPFTPYLLKGFKIPEFILDHLVRDTFSLSIYLLVIIVANVIYFSFIFSFPLILFEDMPVNQAWKESWQRIKKKKGSTFFTVIVSILLFGFVMAVFLTLLTAGMIIYTKISATSTEVVSSFTRNYHRAVPVAALIIETTAKFWFFSVLTTLYHQRGDLRPPSRKRIKKGKLRTLQRVAITVFALIAVIMFSESEVGGALIYSPYGQPIIVAHRSGAIFAPENTLAALEKAISMGADMVEIDVQQLKDGTLIVMHDESFQRTAGENKKVWEVDYQQVQTYDAGSWFSPTFKGEPIPTLEAFLQRAKGRIQVMIELKKTAHQDRLVEGVVKLIEDNDMVDQCNIGSLNLELLREVKELNRKIETVYITALISIGEYDTDFVDAFSVETTMLSREMVVLMNSQRKAVYGWTANSKETIQKNLQAQVDGIVTDDPLLVRHYATQRLDQQLLQAIETMFF